jgi:hypothetical protein
MDESFKLKKVNVYTEGCRRTRNDEPEQEEKIAEGVTVHMALDSERGRSGD